MRNLNGYDMNGRQLRVDYADRNKSNRDSGEGTPVICLEWVVVWPARMACSGQLAGHGGHHKVV